MIALLKEIFLPWLVIAELRDEHARFVRKAAEAYTEQQRFREAAAKFDHDGDGKPGGSRKRK